MGGTAAAEELTPRRKRLTPNPMKANVPLPVLLVAVVLALGAGWGAREMKHDRFQVREVGNVGASAVTMKIDTKTGQTWRHYPRENKWVEIATQPEVSAPQ